MSGPYLCFCGTGKEVNADFLQHCSLFELQHRDLLGQLGDLPGIDIESLGRTRGGGGSRLNFG